MHNQATNALGTRRMTATALAVGILLIGTVGALLAFKAAGGGHGSYLAAKVFFPFAMLSTLLTGTLSPVGIALAAVQFPIYAVVLAAAVLRGRGNRIGAALLGVHVIALVACLILVRGDTFTP